MVATALSGREQQIDAQITERRTDLARSISRYVTWGAASLVALTLFIWLPFRQYDQLLVFSGLALLVAIAAWIYPLLHRRSRAGTGIQLLLGAILLATAALPLLLPETMVTVAIGYVFLVILANMLLGTRYSRWFAAASLVAFVGDVLLIEVVRLDWFAPLATGVGAAIMIGSGAFVLLVVSLIVRQLVRNQEEALGAAWLSGQEVAARALAEQGRREHLQAVVQEYVAYMERVGAGQLAARLTFDAGPSSMLQQDDPLLVLGRSLNQMTDRLQNTIGRIHEAIQDLGSAAAEILASTTQQVAGASEQAAAIAQTNTTVDEVKTIADQSVKRSQQVAEVAARTVAVSGQGQQAIEEMIQSMAEIKTRVEGISQRILTLSEQMQQVGEIVAMIGDIAAQSNILALNASVEAARAGDQGRGFAAVALEVRDLAQRSKEATVQVRTILNDVQRAATATVMATEEGVKGVEIGMQRAGQAQTAIAQLGKVIDEAARAAAQMTAGGQQQQQGMDQVALSMQSINQAMVQSVSSTRQAEKAAQDLNELANGLGELAAQYQL